jgi:Na+/H+-translocating membrane pyrophosphatase
MEHFYKHLWENWDKIATKTNVRTTQAACTSLPQALKVSFNSETVMESGVAGLVILGLGIFFNKANVIYILIKTCQNAFALLVRIMIIQIRLKF